MNWILKGDDAGPEMPQFVEDFSRGEVEFESFSEVGPEIMALQLQWLAAHPQPEARPGLEILKESPYPELSALAKDALEKLQP